MYGREDGFLTTSCHPVINISNRYRTILTLHNPIYEFEYIRLREYDFRNIGVYRREPPEHIHKNQD